AWGRGVAMTAAAQILANRPRLADAHPAHGAALEGPARPAERAVPVRAGGGPGVLRAPWLARAGVPRNDGGSPAIEAVAAVLVGVGDLRAVRVEGEEGAVAALQRTGAAGALAGSGARRNMNHSTSAITNGRFAISRFRNHGSPSGRKSARATPRSRKPCAASTPTAVAISGARGHSRMTIHSA